MKKLMIAAAIVCAAVMAEAAATSWSFSALPPKTAGEQVLACYLMDATVVDRDTIIGNLAKGVFTDLSGDGLVKVGETVAGGSNVRLAAVSLGDTPEGVTKSYYTVILDAKTIADAENFYVTKVNTATAPGTGPMTAAQFGGLGAGQAFTSEWQAISVPEPTSGLLLLLGMAGLALKRRRA